MMCGSFAERNLELKSGPEPLEKEINEILGSKRDTNFLTLLLSWYKKHARFVFFTCFGTVILQGPGHCESSRGNIRR